MAAPNDINSLLTDLHGSLSRYLTTLQPSASATAPDTLPHLPSSTFIDPFRPHPGGVMPPSPQTPSSTFVDPMRPHPGLSDTLQSRNAVQYPGRDPSAFGGSDLQGSERFSQQAGRGTADLSLKNLGIFGRNTMGLMGLASGNPMSMIQAGMKLAQGKPLMQDFEGYVGLPPGIAAGIKTRAQLNAAQAKAQRAHNVALNASRSGRSFGGGTGNTSVAGGRSVGGLAVGNDGRIAGGI